MPMLPPDGLRICELMPIELALRRHQRAARVALVDGRIGLQEVLVAAVAGARGAALRAQDPHRHGLAHAKRVAHRQDDVADARPVGVAERQRRQARGLHVEHRQVGRLVDAHDLGVELAPVGQHDADAVRAVDDMRVGHDAAIGLDDHAAAQTALARLAARSGQAVAEEPAEERVVGDARRRLDAGLLLDPDGDDGGRHARDRVGV